MRPLRVWSNNRPMRSSFRWSRFSPGQSNCAVSCVACNPRDFRHTRVCMGKRSRRVPERARFAAAAPDPQVPLDESVSALAELQSEGKIRHIGLSNVSVNESPGHGSERPDCVAGHVGLELRNVDANYPFERSHRFAGIQPNSGFGDYSRLSCGVGDTQLGRRPGSRQGCLRGRHQPSSRGFPGSEPNSGHGDHSRLSCSAGDQLPSR